MTVASASGTISFGEAINRVTGRVAFSFWLLPLGGRHGHFILSGSMSANWTAGR